MFTPATTMRAMVLQKWKKVTSPHVEELQRKHLMLVNTETDFG